VPKGKKELQKNLIWGNRKRRAQIAVVGGQEVDNEKGSNCHPLSTEYIEEGKAIEEKRKDHPEKKRSPLTQKKRADAWQEGTGFADHCLNGLTVKEQISMANEKL